MEELKAKLEQASALLAEVSAGVDGVAKDARAQMKSELLVAYRSQQESESASEAAMEDLLLPDGE